MSFLWSSSSSSKTNSNTRASTTVVTTEDNSRESAAATTAPNAAAPLQVSHAFKLLIVGDSGVGKSSILSQYVEGEFYKEFVSTLGVDFRSRILRLSGNLTEDLQGDNTSSAGAGSSRSLTGVLAKLQIFDSAGQDRFRAITQSYYRLANGIMLVYDVTNPQSFQSLEAWLRDIRSKGPPGVPILLVGNQADKASWRVISSEEGLVRFIFFFICFCLLLSLSSYCLLYCHLLPCLLLSPLFSLLLPFICFSIFSFSLSLFIFF
ncbi:Ras-related protein Rab-27A, variant 2 [Balamuthia mandrillaris]